MFTFSIIFNNKQFHNITIGEDLKQMAKALLVVGLLLSAGSNIQLATNVRNFMSSRPPGKQTVTRIPNFSSAST